MRHVGRPIAWAIGSLIALAPAVGAQGARTGTVVASFVVASQAKLSVSSATLTFPSGDPDLHARIPASEGPVTVGVKARTSPGSPVVLTVWASDDLRSGLATIAISALAWTASGTGFVGGTMSTTAQTVGTWTSSGAPSGTLTFSLLNAWTYSTGSYGTTLTYTLTAP